MLQFLTYIIAVSTVVCCSLYFYFTRTFDYWKKQNVVGPKPVPFFGNVKDTAIRRKNTGTVSKELYEMFPNEPLIGIYRMTTPVLLIRDLDVIKNIMVKDFDLFRDRGVDYSKTGLGQNMFHADGDTWSALRTRFTPIFTSGKLKSMFHLLNDCAEMFGNYLKKSGNINTEHEIRSLVKRYTMSTISACAFGVNLNCFENKMDQTLIDLDEMILTPSFTIEVDQMYPGLLKRLNLSLFPANVTKFFDKLVKNIISQRIGKPSGRCDFMDLILQLRELGEITSKTKQESDKRFIEITDDIIAAQAFIFYIAGYETSSTAMACLLYHLALNPKIQDKIREEIDSVTKTHGKTRGEITYESLLDMKYLEKAFCEALRMYPILDLQRKATVNYKIPGTDVIIKKGQTVLIPVLGIHYDKKYYPRPEVFDPDRFDPEVVGARHSCAYLPFGVGPRNCIGLRFGSLQSRLGIAKIIANYKVETSVNTTSSLTLNPWRITLAPAEDIFLHLKPRTC